jgi:hypothetical protein
MAYDSVRERMVLFAGEQDPWGITDTWEYDGADWVRIDTAHAPPCRYEHMMAFDAARQRVVLFGGTDLTALTDTWEYDGTDWTRIPTLSTPPGRYGAALTYHPGRKRVLLLGGYSDAGGIHFDDAWEYDGVNWLDVTGAYRPPEGLFDMAAAYHPGLRSLVVQARYDPETYLFRYESFWFDEVCDAPGDEDQDGAEDCADPDCEGQACAGGNCLGGACQ